MGRHALQLCSANLQATLQPFNNLSGASLRSQASLGKDNINLHCAFEHSNTTKERDLEVDVPMMEVIDALQKLLVAEPCGHNYRSALEIAPFLPGNTNQDDLAEEEKY
jgi:hypothetical protein